MNNQIKNAFAFAKKLQDEANEWEKAIAVSIPNENAKLSIQYSSEVQFEINEALMKISNELSLSYVQIYDDLRDSNRMSWAGTAHELREIISNLLRLKAPDKILLKQTWYKQEKNISGPTQRQRVKYILLQRNAGSKERKVVSQVASLDKMIEEIVRSTYKRASDAAHRFKNKNEVKRILRYFETFAIDLLDINI